eukprot:NODE_172_length_2433_cov_42.781440_g167_i0.p1 GENE.NODE_172_length_2433_cov_42.781440_g167_i0~~NODE_172_length_2433_cov_42.781440_g167_i0.p1  ORF type:complete len:806 (+),score=273.06 NODE_172_length_2433_cov_42.781440_g167_i0:208-2418(+)
MDGKFNITVDRALVAKPGGGADANEETVLRINYQGDWKGGMPTGSGSYVFDNGLKFSGAWDDRPEPKKKKGAKATEMLPLAAHVGDNADEDGNEDPNYNGGLEDPRRQLEKVEGRVSQLLLLNKDLERDNTTLTVKLQELQEDRGQKLSAKTQQQAVARQATQMETQLKSADERDKQQKALIATLEKQAGATQSENKKLCSTLDKNQKQLAELKSKWEQANRRAEDAEYQCTKLQKQLDASIKSLEAIKANADTVQPPPQREPTPPLPVLTSEVACNTTAIETEHMACNTDPVIPSSPSPSQPESPPAVANVTNTTVVHTGLSMDELHQQMDNMAETYTRQLADRDNDINTMSQQLKASEAEHSQLKQQISQLRQQLDTAANVKQDEVDDAPPAEAPVDGERLAAAEQGRQTAEEAMAATQAELRAAHRELEELQHKFLLVQEERDAFHSDYHDGKADITLLQRQLQDERDNFEAEVSKWKPQIDRIQDMHEERDDLRADLKLAAADLKQAQTDLRAEKKQRKRAEKMLEESGDVAHLQNQITMLKGELQRSKGQNTALQSGLDSQLDQNAKLKSQSSRFGMLPSSTDKSQIVQMKLTEVQRTLEEKEKLIANQNIELRKVYALEAELQKARDRISYLESSGEANNIKDVTRMMAAQSQMDTRYLLSLKEGERHQEVKRTLSMSGKSMSGASLKPTWSNSSFSESPTYAEDGDGAPIPCPPKDRTRTKPPSRQGRL